MTKSREISLLTRIPNKSATSRDFVLTETFQVDFLFCWHGISIADYNLFHLLIYCSNMSLYVMRYDIYTINDSLFCLCLRTMYIRGKNVVVRIEKHEKSFHISIDFIGSNSFGHYVTSVRCSNFCTRHDDTILCLRVENLL